MSEPEFSDIESDGFPSNISYCDYSENLSDDGDVSSDIEIDMDSSPVINTASEPTIPPKTKNIEPMKRTITKKPIVRKESTSQPLKKEKEPKEPKEPSKTKDVKNENENKNENKTQTADNKFQYNEETIEYFCKDILGDVKKICIVNSSFNNDTALLCLLLKLQIIKEYKCVEKKLN